MNNIERDTPYEAHYKKVHRRRPPQTSRCINTWIAHPILRGVCAEISCPDPRGFMSGSTFLYGGISGLANLAMHPIHRRIDEKIDSSEAKAVNYLFSATMPWIIAAGIMHQTYRASGIALLRMNPKVALGSAAITQILSFIFTDTNADLLREKKLKHPSTISDKSI